MEPTLYGSVVAPGPTETGDQAVLPVAQDGMELAGEAVIRHASGAYIRFSQEGDIVIVPAPGRTATLGALPRPT